MKEQFKKEEAKSIGDELGINWKQVDIDEFTVGLNIEMEHGKRYPETNITDDDHLLTGKIAWAHLKEFRDYYTRLERMEKEADKFWNKKETINW
ncbi:MAG: hypothetical protein OEQ53_08910 [Saprospiraceae bacterium]|nr:hypothetical protein [Saprospiraceae bacterium]